MKDEKSYDRNIYAKSYIPYDTPLKQIYFMGAFFGGLTNNVRTLCNTIIL